MRNDLWNNIQYTALKSRQKKAYELGAPIKKTYPYTNVNAIWAEGYIELNHGYVDSSDRATFTLLKVPTAEQVIEWLLHEHDIICDVCPRNGCFGTTWFAFRFTEFRSKRKKYESDAKDYGSRKEATLAAIDAALDYLSKEK